MKKFTLLSSLAMLATVGGVFAAWTFNETAVSLDEDASVGVNVVQDVTNNARGTFKVTSDVELTFDQLNTTENPWTTAVTGSGNITITYTHNDTVDLNYDYDVKWNIVLPTGWGEGYVTVDTTETTLDLATGTTTLTISGETIASKITGVNNTIDTTEKLDLFETSVAEDLTVKVAI